MTTKRKIEAQRWFQQASYDLKATRWNIEGRFYNTACFLAQQAGEKALKSLLYSQGARRAALMTHSLVEMIREAGKKAPQMKELLDQARALDLHYIPSRHFHVPCIGPEKTNGDSTSKFSRRYGFSSRRA